MKCNVMVMGDNPFFDDDINHVPNEPHSHSDLINIGVECIRMTPAQMADTDKLEKNTIRAIRKLGKAHPTEIAIASIAGFISHNTDIEKLKQHIAKIIVEIEKVQYSD